MDLYTKSFNVVRSVGTACEVTKVELDLVPTFVEAHGHGANKRFHTGCRLVVRCAKTTTNVFVVENLHLKCEVLLQVFDNHHQERELDAQRLLGVCRTCDVVRAHVGSHDFKDRGLNVLVRDSLDVTISNLLVPNLQRLRPNGVKDRQEPRLERVLEHVCAATGTSKNVGGLLRGTPREVVRGGSGGRRGGGADVVRVWWDNDNTNQGGR
jgi:hypothetical protein